MYVTLLTPVKLATHIGQAGETVKVDAEVRDELIALRAAEQPTEQAEAAAKARDARKPAKP